MPTPDPVSAGRKGGASRSDKKRAAARRNGFQPVRKTDGGPQPGCGCIVPPSATPGATGYSPDFETRQSPAPEKLMCNLPNSRTVPVIIAGAPKGAN